MSYAHAARRAHEKKLSKMFITLSHIVSNGAPSNPMPKHAAITIASGSGSKAMLRNSADCKALNIHELKRVFWREDPPRVISAENIPNMSWPRGHFPYPRCKGTRKGTRIRKIRPMTVLMVADYKYTQLIPSWAEQVQGLQFPCAVGDVGNADTSNSTTTTGSRSACAVAAAVGCECFTPPSRAPSTGHRWDLNSVMALAVRWRFRYAYELLQRGRSVFMHDADVLFRPGGMEAVARWLDRAPRVDFAVQHNGIRRESYDDLNWGFVWMSGSNTSMQILGCLLDVWMHKAFAGPAHSAYHARSQPRINHVFESAIQSAPDVKSAPKLCTFRPDFLERTMKHFSGYKNADHKLMCARAMGIFDDTPASLAGRLIYGVPLTVTPYEQKRALAGAIVLGDRLNLGVAIPPAVWNFKLAPFCHLHDAMRLPPQRLVRAVNSNVFRRACAVNATHTNATRISGWGLDAATLLPRGSKIRAISHPKIVQEEGVDNWKRSSFRIQRLTMLRTKCVSFRSLQQLGETAAGTEYFSRFETCNPTDKGVTAMHGCHDGIWRKQ